MFHAAACFVRGALVCYGKLGVIMEENLELVLSMMPLAHEQFR